MRVQMLFVAAMALCVLASSVVSAQDEVLPAGADTTQTTPETTPDEKSTPEPVPGDQPADQPAEPAKDEFVDKTLDRAKETVSELSEKIDEDERAQEFSAGVLKPIYTVAEALAFPAFHWLAFALMATGVVSFALQLVLGKLVVLANMGFSLKEILADALGLAISVIGLVLTTQAAAENSTFTASAAAVLSATITGIVLGFVFYLWGQSQEVEAARGRSALQQAESKKK
ncbi:hypothetical protein KOR42_38270 [Thalassoglobus neptunius]|uniref:Uncharacterized protein n=1 Tax=Thalassoglobus neptunius TaxID=1938619 RepID=A0A5C5WIF2_9PLAN|nr:hypothetical protein [Thalassoglobus neptunius]TWT49875.1 hypothetical protein KOR42_38270 [Thalassoglobus neptunius]